MNQTSNLPYLPQEIMDLIFEIKDIQEQPFKNQMKKALDEMLSIGIPHIYPVERFLSGPCLIYDKEDIEESGKYEEHWVEQFRWAFFGFQ
tara:strand:- start:1114 stop:1383 length:270 start_codon:yes stop_codon:yes gene_type:complete